MRKHIKRIIQLSSLSILLSSNIAIARPFTLNQKIINPVCIWLLLNTHSYAGYDSSGNSAALSYFKNKKHSIINSINLDACANSQTTGKVSVIPAQKYQPALIQYQFPWGINNNFNQALPRGRFTYQYIGHSRNGINVLKTISSGGGSGEFNGLALLRIKPHTLITAGPKNMQWRRHHFSQLSLIAFIAGGDRASGGFKDIKIKGNTLEVIRYNPNNTPNNPTLPVLHVRYDLTKL